MQPKFRGLWQHPDFVRLWAGETISIFGSLIGGLAMLFTAILWLDASPLEVAILSACQMAPGFVVGLIAGVWVDRLARRPILIACDLGRFFALATIPVAALFDMLTLPQLYLVALTASSLTVFFDVAYEAYLPTLVEPEDLVEGNSKLTASASVAEFGSFSVSGWLVQLVKGPGAILIDATSFLASAFCVWRIHTPEPSPAPAHERQHVAREAIDGLRLVRKQPLLRAFAVATVFFHFGRGLLSVVYMLYLNREIGFGPGVLGMIFAVGGVTGLLGALAAGRAHWFGGLGPALVVSVFVRGIGMLFMPLASSVSALGVGLLVANQVVTDPAWAFYEINEVSLRQAITPQRLQGRMNASMRFIGFGPLLAGTAAGGLLGEWLGVRETLFIAVGMTFVAGVWLALSPIARLGSMPAAEGETLLDTLPA